MEYARELRILDTNPIPFALQCRQEQVTLAPVRHDCGHAAPLAVLGPPPARAVS
jgi:hypothetical protein